MPYCMLRMGFKSNCLLGLLNESVFFGNQLKEHMRNIGHQSPVSFPILESQQTNYEQYEE